MKYIKTQTLFEDFINKYIEKDNFQVIFATEGLNDGWEVVYGTKDGAIRFSTTSNIDRKRYDSFYVVLKEWFFEGKEIMIFNSFYEFCQFNVENPNATGYVIKSELKPKAK